MVEGSGSTHLAARWGHPTRARPDPTPSRDHAGAAVTMSKCMKSTSQRGRTWTWDVHRTRWEETGQVDTHWQADCDSTLDLSPLQMQ